jgi:hypothetical protein
MWVLALEAGVAAGLLIFIMWWTLGSATQKEKQRKRDAQAKRAEDTTDSN